MKYGPCLEEMNWILLRSTFGNIQYSVDMKLLLDNKHQQLSNKTCLKLECQKTSLTNPITDLNQPLELFGTNVRTVTKSEIH